MRFFAGRVTLDHIEAIKRKKTYKYYKGNQREALFLINGRLEGREISTTTEILSKEWILELIKQGIKMEKIFKKPQDIEWGIYNNELYTLQSRPITI